MTISHYIFQQQRKLENVPHLPTPDFITCSAYFKTTCVPADSTPASCCHRIRAALNAVIFCESVSSTPNTNSRSPFPRPLVPPSSLVPHPRSTLSPSPSSSAGIISPASASVLTRTRWSRSGLPSPPTHSCLLTAPAAGLASDHTHGPYPLLKNDATSDTSSRTTRRL